MIHLSIKRLLLAFTALFAFAMTGCTFENEYGVTPGEGIQTDGDHVTITVKIPGQNTPFTRSIDAGGGEAVVDAIDLLIFENTGSGLVLSEHVQGENIDQTGGTNANSYQVQFKARITANTSAKTVVVIANAAAEVDAVVNAGGTPGAALGDTKAAILDALVHPETAPSDYKWVANNGNPSSSAAMPIDPSNGVGDYMPIPMYGEYTVPSGGITSGMKMTGIDLVRMLARIDVVNNASGFTLTDIYIVNYNDAGYIASAWNTADGSLLSALPATPMIPGSATALTGQNNALVYSNAGGIASLTGEIYVYEAPATSGTKGIGHSEALCVIVKGRLASDGNDYYYRMDFTDAVDAQGEAPYLPNGITPNPAFDHATVKYLPVYRNHSYTFTVGAVNGVGYPATPAGFTEALNSLGILNNMKTELLVLNESELTSTVFNGQHYLSLGGDVTLDAQSGSAANVKCATDYWGGWSLDRTKGQGLDGIEYANAADMGWLTISPAGEGTSAGTLQVTATSVCTAAREAYVHVKAGTLTHKVKVMQEYILYVGMFGGELKKDAVTGEWQFTKPLYVDRVDEVSMTGIQWQTSNAASGLTTDNTNGRLNTWNLRSTTFPAANLCYNKNGGTPSAANMTWYLPAQKQLMAVYVANESYPGENKLSLNSRYWSATEYSASGSWFVQFYDGYTAATTKTSKFRGRCVRE